MISPGLPRASAPQVSRVVTPAAARRSRAAAVAQAVSSVPGVALHSSSLLTADAGIRPEAPGIAMSSDRVRVSVVIQQTLTVGAAADRIRQAVAQVWDGPVDVHIADVAIDNKDMGPHGPEDEETR